VASSVTPEQTDEVRSPPIVPVTVTHILTASVQPITA
jgi:hypothetical protein